MFGFVVSTSLTISIISTIFFLYKFNVSNTAWIYTVLAGISFFYAGITKVFLTSAGTSIEFSWASPLGIPGGYILIFQAIYQYSLDKRKRKEELPSSDNIETLDVALNQ